MPRIVRSRRTASIASLSLANRSIASIGRVNGLIHFVPLRDDRGRARCGERVEPGGLVLRFRSDDQIPPGDLDNPLRLRIAELP